MSSKLQYRVRRARMEFIEEMRAVVDLVLYDDPCETKYQESGLLAGSSSGQMPFSRELCKAISSGSMYGREASKSL